MWRVLEQRRANCIAVKDSDYDKVTEFKNKDKSFHYYISVRDNNYKTVSQELRNGKWESIMSSCYSKHI